MAAASSPHTFPRPPQLLVQPRSAPNTRRSNPPGYSSFTPMRKPQSQPPTFHLRLWIATPPRTYHSSGRVITRTPPSRAIIESRPLAYTPIKRPRPANSKITSTILSDKKLKHSIGHQHACHLRELPLSRRLSLTSHSKTESISGPPKPHTPPPLSKPRILLTIPTPPLNPDGSFHIPSTPPSLPPPTSRNHGVFAPVRKSRSADDEISAATELDWWLKEMSMSICEDASGGEEGEMGEEEGEERDGDEYLGEYASRKLEFFDDEEVL